MRSRNVAGARAAAARHAALVLSAALVLLPGLARPAAGAETTLADAAEKRDLSQVQALLEKGAKAQAAQVDGTTALHWAAHHDDVAMAALLVRAGADVNSQNRYEVPPLALACINGSERMVRLLLDAGADVEAAQRGGETPLMTAARTGKPGAVRALLAAGAKVDATERSGQTALMWAAADGNLEVVRDLLSAGADAHKALRSGFTPLFFAVREGRTAVVHELLAAGLDVNETMKPRGGADKARLNGMSPLLLAVENGHFELAAELLDVGADPNDLRSGYTALHTIARVRKTDRGDDGDPSPPGSGNMSSLELVHRLVERGADVNARLTRGARARGRLTEEGSTPLMLAADTADAPMMRTLVELGADPLLPNADNCPPLLAAAGVGTRAPGEEAGTEDEVIEAVELLLEWGADINAVDDNGETAMHGAAYKSFPRVVELLDRRGADINVWNRKNANGWTPLLIAQGYRVGNFRPMVETIAALERVMRAAGVEPPPPPSRSPDADRKGYEGATGG